MKLRLKLFAPSDRKPENFQPNQCIVMLPPYGKYSYWMFIENLDDAAQEFITVEFP